MLSALAVTTEPDAAGSADGWLWALPTRGYEVGAVALPAEASGLLLALLHAASVAIAATAIAATTGRV